VWVPDAQGDSSASPRRCLPQTRQPPEADGRQTGIGRPCLRVTLRRLRQRAGRLFASWWLRRQMTRTRSPALVPWLQREKCEM
jgi:hypothetical protein